MCHIQDRQNFRLAVSRELNGSSGKCSRECRTRAAVPWSLNGSNLVVEVALIPYPSGKCNFNVFPGRIRIRIRSRVSISSVSPGASHRVQPSSPNLESSRVSAVDIVVLAFSSSDRSSDDRADGTVKLRTARVSSVRLCTMGDFSG